MINEIKNKETIKKVLFDFNSELFEEIENRIGEFEEIDFGKTSYKNKFDMENENHWIVIKGTNGKSFVIFYGLYYPIPGEVMESYITDTDNIGISEEYPYRKYKNHSEEDLKNLLKENGFNEDSLSELIDMLLDAIQVIKYEGGYINLSKFSNEEIKKIKEVFELIGNPLPI
jgi:hypothetical protein